MATCRFQKAYVCVFRKDDACSFAWNDGSNFVMDDDFFARDDKGFARNDDILKEIVDLTFCETGSLLLLEDVARCAIHVVVMIIVIRSCSLTFFQICTSKTCC